MGDFYPPEWAALPRAVLDKVLAVAPQSGLTVLPVPQVVLIGGWGTWSHSGGLHSYDIGLVVRPAMVEVFSAHFGPLDAGAKIIGPKWRAKVDGFALELYVTGESLLGKVLELDVGELVRGTQQRRYHRVLTPAGQAATKLADLLDRPDCLEGEADRAQCWALSRLGVEPRAFANYLRTSTKPRSDVAELADIGLSLLGDLALTSSERAELRRWKREVLSCLGPKLPPGLNRRRQL